MTSYLSVWWSNICWLTYCSASISIEWPWLPISVKRIMPSNSFRLTRTYIDVFGDKILNSSYKTFVWLVWRLVFWLPPMQLIRMSNKTHLSSLQTTLLLQVLWTNRLRWRLLTWSWGSNLSTSAATRSLQLWWIYLAWVEFKWPHCASTNSTRTERLSVSALHSEFWRIHKDSWDHMGS